MTTQNQDPVSRPHPAPGAAVGVTSQLWCPEPLTELRDRFATVVDRVALELTADALDGLFDEETSLEDLWSVALTTAARLYVAVESDKTPEDLAAELSFTVCAMWQLTPYEAEAVVDFHMLLTAVTPEQDLVEFLKRCDTDPYTWVRMALLSTTTAVITFTAGGELLPSHLLEVLAG